MRLVCTGIDRLSVIWKFDVSDKIKRDLYEAAAVSVLLYGRPQWAQTKRLEEKKTRWELNKNTYFYFEQILGAITNKTAAVQPLTPIS